MNLLDQKEQEKIRKMSEKRLISLLTRAGIDPDELEAMDRNIMIERWAKLVSVGGDKPPSTEGAAAAVKAVTTGYDVELERNRLAFEGEKFETRNEADQLQKRKRNEKD